MIDKTSDIELFKQQMCDSLRTETFNSRAITIDKNSNVYSNGDQDEAVYFIESGQIKLLMLSPEGRECLLAIHSTGDIFGELCLSGIGSRLETATAMEITILKRIPRQKFFMRLSSNALIEGYVQYLAMRIAEQQQVIGDLIMADSEQRLGKIILQLGHKLGKKVLSNTRIEFKISHEELSEMVGTTRPRISMFMQRFRSKGLIETNPEHYLIIKENKLAAYLAEIA